MTDYRLYSEDSVPEKISITPGMDLYYIKLVGIGPNALAKADNRPKDIVSSIQGFYVYGSIESIEQNLHSIIANACQQRKAQNEQTKGQ